MEQQCPLCKAMSIQKRIEGTVGEPKIVARCECCGFSWEERYNEIAGRQIVTNNNSILRV